MQEIEPDEINGISRKKCTILWCTTICDCICGWIGTIVDAWKCKNNV